MSGTGAAPSRIRIASRGSALARWQSEHVRDLLLEAGVAEVEIVVVRTTGDRITDVPLARIGDRGLFTREVDDALLDGRADLAVHSLKDVPTLVPEGLDVVAVLEREDPADVLVPPPHGPSTLAGLPAGARVGTSSLRRRAQLAALRPGLQIVDLRGNVDTRLERVREGTVDAAILARAGLLRLGLAADAGERLAAPHWLPAVGQGALAVVGRRADAPGEAARLDHAPTRACVRAERAFLRRLEGGCQIPIGALATLEAGQLHLSGGVFSLDGRIAVRDTIRGGADEAEALGIRLAEALLERGAGEVLGAIREATPRREVPAP